MAYQASAVDTTEPFSDTDWEIVANLASYNVVSGCALTYDAADMTVDIAAGVVTHNGSSVVVSAQADAVTLVSDGSNPRWAWIYVDSGGTGGITHGTAAATPSKPEGGDNVILGAVLIAASATIANDQTKIDKRIPTPSSPRTLWIPITSDASAFPYPNQIGQFVVDTMNATDTADFVFRVPADFTSLTTAELICIPDATETIQWDVVTDFGADGEAPTANEESSLNNTEAVTATTIEGLDVSGALSAIAADDYVGMEITSDTTVIRPFGLYILYS